MAAYADLTWNDPNPLKRWVQRRRLADALACVSGTPDVIVDFGAGDGALAAMALARWPGATVICFEPSEDLARQAQIRLGGRARVVRTEADLPARAEVIFCTEVFEHLPEAETEIALGELASRLAPGGTLVVGVPVEVGPPALAKGLFRAMRRGGDYDGSLRRIRAAAAGKPPTDRPVADWGGRGYHPHHLGFDHRVLRTKLEARFGRVTVGGSPFGWLPVFLNSEAYMTATRAPEDA